MRVIRSPERKVVVFKRPFHKTHLPRKSAKLFPFPFSPTTIIKPFPPDFAKLSSESVCARVFGRRKWMQLILPLFVSSFQSTHNLCEFCCCCYWISYEHKHNNNTGKNYAEHSYTHTHHFRRKNNLPPIMFTTKTQYILHNVFASFLFLLLRNSSSTYISLVRFLFTVQSC